MNKFLQLFILLLGVSLYSQDALTVKDGAYGYDKDFILEIHLKTDAKKSSGTTTGKKDLYASGTTSGVENNKLIDASQSFKSLVKVGDVVRNTTDNTYAFIWGIDPDGDGIFEIDDDTFFTLSADIMESGDNYEIGFGLLDDSKSFTSSVSVGDLVKNTTDNTSAFINRIYDDKSIDLSTDIMESGETYEIDTAIKALQFDLNYDGGNFNYLSSYDLNKTRLGGDDSGFSVTVNKIGSNKLRVLIYSSSNKTIPTGDGKLLSLDFHNSKQFGNYDFELTNVIASTLASTNLSYLNIKNGTIITQASSLGWNFDSLEFGDVLKGETKDLQWVLKNEGTADLTLDLEKSELTKYSLTDWATKTN